MVKQNLDASLKWRQPRGFSLLEVIIAIALIALLATIAINQIGNVFGGGQESVARLFVKNSLEVPLFQYNDHTGSYPSTAEGLKALLAAPSGKKGWRGPYVREIPKDPWKKEYKYRFPGQKNPPSSYDLWSLGPDGIDSTADDIGNWETTTN